MVIAPGGDGPDAVVELRLLSEKECRKVHGRVRARRERWTRRHPELPFFSLDAASHLDASREGAAAYLDRDAVSNPLLAEHFGWLHERLREARAAHVGAPCEHVPGLALPVDGGDRWILCW